MATRALSPFTKHFPIEIHNEILKFCDPSTLAKVGRVSLAFLELSSPLLYRDVELVGMDKMAELFCDREARLLSSLSSASFLKGREADLSPLSVLTTSCRASPLPPSNPIPHHHHA